MKDGALWFDTASQTYGVTTQIGDRGQTTVINLSEPAARYIAAHPKSLARIYKETDDEVRGQMWRKLCERATKRQGR